MEEYVFRSSSFFYVLHSWSSTQVRSISDVTMLLECFYTLFVVLKASSSPNSVSRICYTFWGKICKTKFLVPSWTMNWSHDTENDKLLSELILETAIIRTLLQSQNVDYLSMLRLASSPARASSTISWKSLFLSSLQLLELHSCGRLEIS